MNHKGLIFQGLCVAFLWSACLPVWSGMKDQEEAEPQVQMWVEEVCVGSDMIGGVFDQKITWFPVEFSILFGVDMPAPFCLGADSEFQRDQGLMVTDDQGNLLAPAEYCWGYEEEQGGVSVSQLKLRMKELPPEGVAFVNLKGELRLSVDRKVASPVYVLPLKEQASLLVQLPDENEGWQGVPEDIVVGGALRQGTLAIKQVRRLERDGKQMLEVEVELSSEAPLKFNYFQLCNKTGEKMNVETRGVAWFTDPDCNILRKSQTLEFEDPKGLDQLGIRLIHKQAVKTVLVPVDLRVGVCGEIPKAKTPK